MRDVLAQRWPRLPDREARRYVQRWLEGRSPYSRIRAHAIRLQLEAVIALAGELGLRRSELFSLTVDSVHPDNTAVIVWRNGVEWSDSPREVPFTRRARKAVQEWLEFRELLGIDHDKPWVKLWGETDVGAPIKRHAFDAMLRTYVGEGWTYKRLRDTCAARWIRAGLPLEHTRRLLGIDSLEAMLPYAALVTGFTETAMQRVEDAFIMTTAGTGEA
jgi:integrase